MPRVLPSVCHVCSKSPLVTCIAAESASPQPHFFATGVPSTASHPAIAPFAVTAVLYPDVVSVNLTWDSYSHCHL